MKRQLIKIRRKIKPEDIYSKPGLDNASRLFLISIKENLIHQNRREKFKEWNGYQPRY